MGYTSGMTDLVGEKTVKVGPKGQVVVPKAIRERLGINPGDEVVVSERDGEARVRKPLSLDQLHGVFKDAPGGGTAELEREHREELELEGRKMAEVDRWLNRS